MRQYPVGKYHSGKNGRGKPLGFKTRIGPSKGAIKQHNQEIREIVHQHQGAPQEALIGQLNPVIQGWANYHRIGVAKAEFSRCDMQLYGKLRAWAKYRHPNKTPGWRASKYWKVNNGEGWMFQTQQGHVLKKHAATQIVRHVKVRGTASPYDGNLIYWAQRLKTHPMLKSRTGILLKLQHGKCSYCGLTFRDDDLMETDHIIPRTLGGDDSMKNLQLMHRHCHDQKTAKDGSNRQGRGIHDKDSLDSGAGCDESRMSGFVVGVGMVICSPTTSDGAGSASGDTSFFLAFKRHPVVAPQLAGAHLGSADEETRDWLLVDQAQQLLYLAEVEEARRFLVAQWPHDDVPLEDTEAALARRLADGWQEMVLPSDWHDRLAETVRESRANYALMMRWLGQRSGVER